MNTQEMLNKCNKCLINKWKDDVTINTEALTEIGLAYERSSHTLMLVEKTLQHQFLSGGICTPRGTYWAIKGYTKNNQ